MKRLKSVLTATSRSQRKKETQRNKRIARQGGKEFNFRLIDEAGKFIPYGERVEEFEETYVDNPFKKNGMAVGPNVWKIRKVRGPFLFLRNMQGVALTDGYHFKYFLLRGYLPIDPDVVNGEPEDEED